MMEVTCSPLSVTSNFLFSMLHWLLVSIKFNSELVIKMEQRDRIGMGQWLSPQDIGFVVQSSVRTSCGKFELFIRALHLAPAAYTSLTSWGLTNFVSQCIGDATNKLLVVFFNEIKSCSLSLILTEKTKINDLELLTPACIIFSVTSRARN